MKAPQAAVCGQHGQITFYLIVVLPIALSLTMLTVDLSNWQLARERAQAEADRIALAAVELLPDEAAAAAYVEQAVSNLDGLSLSSGEDNAGSLQIASGTIRLTLHGTFRPSFSVFLPQSAGRPLLPVAEQAEARIVPGDYLLILADAASLRPPFLEHWGERQDWPPAEYFAQVTLPCGGKQAAAAELLCRPGARPAYDRWATQSCYNPLFSALKRAALYLLDRYSAVGGSRSGLLFTPGDYPAAGYQLGAPLREIHSRGGLQWGGGYDPVFLLSDELCIYASEYSRREGSRYQLPGRLYAPAPPLPDGCRIFPPGFPASLHAPAGRLDSCALSSLLPRELVYFRAARSISHEPDGGNIRRAIAAALDELKHAGSAAASRGALAFRARRNIIVLADRFPEISGDLLAEKPDMLRVVLLAYADPQLPNAEQTISRLNMQQRALPDIPSLESYLAVGSDELRRILVERIAAAGREAALQL